MDKEEFTKNILINDFINEIQKKNYSNNTLMSYINDLYYFRLFVKKDLNNVKEEDIRDYLEYLNLQKEKPASVRRKISSLKSFYKFLYKNNYIEKKDYPLYKISYPKVDKRLPKFVYYNDLLDIIRESTNDKDGVRDRLIIEMLYATGLRVSELVIVQYGEYAEDVLKEYLLTHKNTEGYLFINSRGGKLTERGVRYIIDNIMKRLSIKTHVTPHVLRHTFATDMLNNGCDIKVVQELLGHSSLKATEIYTHVTNEHLKKVYYECFPRRDKDE